MFLEDINANTGSPRQTVGRTADDLTLYKYLSHSKKRELNVIWLNPLRKVRAGELAVLPTMNWKECGRSTPVVRYCVRIGVQEMGSTKQCSATLRRCEDKQKRRYSTETFSDLLSCIIYTFKQLPHWRKSSNRTFIPSVVKIANTVQR
jgi:hypothetical protein